MYDSFVTQTLRTLNLKWNHQIGAEGAAQFASALSTNMVSRFPQMLISYSYDRHFPQTLTTLNFEGNKIDDEGERHFANALQMNTVSRLMYILTIISWLLFYIGTNNLTSEHQ